MNRNAKIALNVIGILAVIASFAWGTVVRGLGNWGTRTYSSWWNSDIFWANICQIVIPIAIIALLIVLNKKKSFKK